MRFGILAAVPIVALLASTMVTPADATLRRLRTHYEPGQMITAYSHYGNGSIQSVVRPARRYGWQVQLPGGAWTDCRRSCEETLRVQTVDIFGDGDYSLSGGGYGTMTRECGVLGCLNWGFSF
jgi:hypothetical protein